MYFCAQFKFSMKKTVDNSMCEMTKLYKKSVNILPAMQKNIWKLAVVQIEYTG